MAHTFAELAGDWRWISQKVVYRSAMSLTDALGRCQVPDPTLDLTNVVASSTLVIEAPQTQIVPGDTIGATLYTHAAVVNDGTIGQAVNGSGYRVSRKI